MFPACGPHLSVAACQDDYNNYNRMCLTKRLYKSSLSRCREKSHESKRPPTFHDLSSRVRFFISVSSFFVSMHVYPMFADNVKRSRPQLLKSIGSKRRPKVLFLKKSCYYHIYDGFQNSQLKSVDCDKEQCIDYSYFCQNN